MKRIKKSFGIVLCFFVFLTSFVNVNGEEIYNGEFIKRKYTLCNLQSVTLNEADKLLNITEPLGQKTEICFSFTLDESFLETKVNILAQKFHFSKSDYLLSVFIKKTSCDISLSCIDFNNTVNIISNNLKIGKTYSITLQIDTKNSEYNFILYEGINKNKLICYKRGLKNGIIQNSYGFTGIEFENFSANFSNFGIYRERFADNKPVIDIRNNIAVVGVNIDESINTGDVYDVYAAFYSKDRKKLIAIESKKCIYTGCDNYSEVIFPLNDSFKKSCPLSIYTFRSNNIFPLSNQSTVNIASGRVSYDSMLTYTGFEAEEEYKNSSSVVCGKLPDKWYAQGWEGPLSPYDIEMASDDNGSYISLDAVEKGYMGIRCAGVPLTENGLRISFYVKYSDDYKGNYPRIVFLYFDDNGSFVDSSYEICNGAVSYTWKKEILYISPEDYPMGASKVSVAFCTSNKDATYGGKLYYDSLTVDDLVFNMECKEELSWYKTGEIVVYNPKYPLCNDISKICGSIYNSDGILIDEISLDSAYVTENGWSYMPFESGFYKIIFHAILKDGRTIFEHSDYKAYYDETSGNLYHIERASHDFYVTDFDNIEMKKRNSLYGMSVDNYDGQYDFSIAEKLGMSFIRLHAFSWMDIEPENVTLDNNKEYNWEKYDKIFDKIKNTDLNFDVIGNILYTPKWASPSDDESGMKPMYSSYAPTDMTYLNDFIKDLYARYGDVINTWEIYNEPHLPSAGGSVFWHDTPENYVKMLSNAYSTLKSLSNGEDTVFMGGIGARRYLSFYREFLQKGGWQYTDKLVMHGYDLDPWNYLNVNSNLGLNTDKGVINTEAHMILFNQSYSDIYYTEKQLALRMLLEYFRQIKYGVEKIAFFQAYDNHLQGEDLMILDNMSDNRDVVTAGVFRKKPSYQPRFAAGALNTLISMSGKNIAYCDEFKSGNVNIVEFKSDGKPLYVLWCDNLEEMHDADILTFDEAVVIRDWEGRKISPQNFSVNANKVYFVEGLNENAFSYLASSKGDKIYNGDVLYCENEMNKKEANGPEAFVSPVKLFDHESNEVCDYNDTKWNELTLFGGMDLNSDFAINACDDGIDVVVRTDNVSSMNKAYMVFGADTFANGIQMDVVEISASMYENGSAVTKTKAPNIGGDLPSDDYSDVNETVNGAVAFVSKNDDYSYFCIHIPFTQLYPYFYSEDARLNFGLKFIGYNESDSEITRYCFGNGYSPYNPEKFGNVTFGSQVVENGLLDIEINTNAGEYVAAQLLKDGDVVYVNQYIADENGKCNVRSKIEQEGNYILKTYSDSIGYETFEFTYNGE